MRGFETQQTSTFHTTRSHEDRVDTEYVPGSSRKQSVNEPKFTLFSQRSKGKKMSEYIKPCLKWWFVHPTTFITRFDAQKRWFLGIDTVLVL